MTRTLIVVGTATLIAGLGIGCDRERTAAEEQERAVEAVKESTEEMREAEQEAAQETREAQQEAAQETREAQQEAEIEVPEAEREPVRGSEVQDEKNEKIAEAREEMNEKKAEAKAEARETITEAKQEIGEQRRELREWGENELRDVDKALDELDTEAAEAAPAVRRRVEASLTKLRAECDEVMSQLAAIEDTPAVKLDGVKARLESKFEQLDGRVETLRDSL